MDIVPQKGSPMAGISCRSTRIEFTRDARGYGFQLFLADGSGGWRAASAAGNPLVRGHCFDLFADEVEHVSPTHLRLRGHKRAPGDGLDYRWHASVQADEPAGWIDVSVTIDSATPITLRHERGFEPELIIDLGELPPYERGDHVWFMTNVANPTRWNDDAWGNDCPATYYFDPYKRLELIMFYDMTAMSWMSFDNIARFCNYRVGLRRQYQSKPTAELGMYATGFSGMTFPAGQQSFGYSITARPRERGPTDREAVVELVERSLEKLPRESPWPARATSWRDFSVKCARELMHEPHCWRRDASGNDYLLNYVGAHSVIWNEALTARAVPFTFDQPCLESGVWTALPLATLKALDPDPALATLYRRTADFSLRYARSGQSFIDKPVVDDKLFGTWQYVYILEQLFQVARLDGDDAVVQLIVDEVRRFTIPFARKMSYLFPLSFGRQSMEKQGSGDAHSVACVYASFMLDLHEQLGDSTYLAEATTAMRLLGRLPINTVTQELMLHAIGVQVAGRLFVATGDEFFAEQQRYLQAQVLRQQYWYQDRTTPAARRSNTLGSFMACGVINYPAIFENIEAIARISVGFKWQAPTANVLRVVEHARRNNFYFFPQVVDEPVTAELAHVPYEGMAILEGPVASDVGQEIYGAGWTFRACLLWEAYCTCDDRDILVMNLNSFEELALRSAKRPRYSFVVFNSTTSTRHVRLTLANALKPNSLLIAGDRWESLKQLELDDDGSFELSLEPDQILLFDVVVDRF